jgi:hypothetical protein
MESYVPSAIALGTLFAAAVVLAVSRSPIPADQLKSVNKLVLIACGAQLLHFLEETAFDLHVRLPEAFGLPEMPFSFFLALNVAVLIIWLAGACQREFNPFVVTTFWFLGLASVFNLLAHPTLAVISGAYFPGVFTSPVVGLAGLMLTRRLVQATSGDLDSGRAA